MISKRERKLYQWLSRGRITDMQLFKMRESFRAELLRLVLLNSWLRDDLTRAWWTAKTWATPKSRFPALLPKKGLHEVFKECPWKSEPKPLPKANYYRPPRDAKITVEFEFRLTPVDDA